MHGGDNQIVAALFSSEGKSLFSRRDAGQSRRVVEIELEDGRWFLFTGHPTSDGGVVFNYEQCFECGTCYLVCDTEGALTWTYPDGGHGVVFARG